MGAPDSSPTPLPMTPALGWRAQRKRCAEIAERLDAVTVGLIQDQREHMARQVSRFALRVRALGDDFGQMPKVPPGEASERYAVLVNRMVRITERAGAYFEAIT